MRLTLHGLRHRLPPGPGHFPWIHPIVGLRMRRDMLGELMRQVEAFGPVFTLRMPGMHVVFLVSPEANQRILVTHARDFLWEQGLLGELIPFIGRGLLTTDDEEHDRARRLLMPSFTMARVRGYTDDIVRIVDEAASRLPSGRPLELHAWARALTLRVATDVILGMHGSEALARELAHHFEQGLGLWGGSYVASLVLRGPGTPFRRMLGHVAQIDRVLFAEIERRRRSGARDDSVLDTLVHATDGADRLSTQEIRDQALTLLFAGHDTTAATVSWLFALVGRYPEVQRRLQQELDAQLGARPATVEDLVRGLPYLDQVLKETLRLYPPAWFGPRRTRAEFELHGHTIPAGTQVAYCSWITHRLPELWAHPEAFDPERFSEARAQMIVPGAYVPFGRGARLCIGRRFGELEVKAIALALLRRYDVQLEPAQSFAARTIPTISPRHGVRLRLLARGHERAPSPSR
jgi:cytochrome P450